MWLRFAVAPMECLPEPGFVTAFRRFWVRFALGRPKPILASFRKTGWPTNLGFVPQILKSKLLSIVIACRNEERHIRRCLTALLEGTVPDVEVIVVDGKSSDSSRAICEEMAKVDPRLRLLDNPARITPVAFNIGVQAAKGDCITICGAHAEPASDWAERNLAALAAHTEAVAVGGQLETVGETGIGRVVAAVMSSHFGVGNARFRTGGQPGYVDTVAFACYRRTAFSGGLFDERLATNQDDDFNTRLIARGEKLWFDPIIRCRYFARPSWNGMLLQHWRYGRHKFRVFRNSGRIGSWRQLVPAVWVAFLAAAALTRRGWPVIALYCLCGLIAGLPQLGRLRLRAALFLPVAASLHLAYGLGFWAGLLTETASS